MVRLELPIEGMTCEHCVRTVSDALRRVPGVRSAQVSLADAKAIVEWENGTPQRDALLAAVAQAGYRVRASKPRPPLANSSSSERRSDPNLLPPMRTAPSKPREATAAAPAKPRDSAPASAAKPTPPRDSEPAIAAAPTKSSSPPPLPQSTGPQELLLDVDGMTCASCVSRVEKALAHVPGVTSARANLATNQASVVYEPQRASLEALLEAVRKAGYRASPSTADEVAGRGPAERAAHELSKWQGLLACGVVLLMAVIVLDFFAPPGPGRMWGQFACATVLQLALGWPFYWGALRRALTGSTNMDTLVAVGTSAAYGAGVYSLFEAAQHGGHAQQMYLMDAGTILTFITLGKYLEARAKGRASAAIVKLLDLAPPEANVMRDGKLAIVAPGEVAVGETIVVRPGEKVPLDAEVLTGHSTLDQSWLTGESVPVVKSPGDEILAGTINGDNALSARVVRGAGGTALAQVVTLVRRAQESKTEIQRLADRVVGWFVPVVLLIALLSLVVWGAVANDWLEGTKAMVAVLVVACPCALGLATPTAILVASGRGAELGILIKEAHSLELAGRITTVVLDKTGTVTRGKPVVARLLPYGDATVDELLATAASVEQLTRHPLAAPIVAAAREQNLRLPPADSLEIVPGQGVVARGRDGAVLVGNDHLLAARGINFSSHASEMETLRQQGQTPLGVASGNRYLGLIAVADVVSPHSREAVDQLKQLGIDVLLLSGDHRRVAERVAREVGIDKVTAEVLPGQKQAVIMHLRDSGQVVAMVGDGINDAPALAAADLGIAIGSGSDIAIEAADIVVTGDDLRSVPRTVLLARATLRTIRQNLGWAFVYNVVLIPLAAGVLVPVAGVRLPGIAAAAAMALSSVSVVVNSLLLSRAKLSAKPLKR